MLARGGNRCLYTRGGTTDQWNNCRGHHRGLGQSKGMGVWFAAVVVFWFFVIVVVVCFLIGNYTERFTTVEQKFKLCLGLQEVGDLAFTI